MSETAPETGPAVRDLPQLLKAQGAKDRALDAPLIPVALVMLGGYLTWFGVHYWRDVRTKWPSDPIKDVLRGKGIPKPDREQPIAEQVAQSSPDGGFSGTVTGKAIAADAQKYVGVVRYDWGGANPSTGWDCSGLVNYVLCHDMKLSIPGNLGGTFTGDSHGPDVADYLKWDGAAKVLGPISTPSPGDLVCWGPNQHMGIAINETELVSAEDPANGTKVGKIAGFFPFPPVILRIKELQAYAGAGGGGTPQQNRNLAKLLTARLGWSPSQSPGQWEALDKLWERESAWKTDATNPTSGAYGIPQALPASKMGSAGANWKTSARTQILWGLGYIKARYGSPEKAWAHEEANGWY
jgi:cell wall-associated NlpC family hydrolase